jgi:hypothetical protein
VPYHPFTSLAVHTPAMPPTAKHNAIHPTKEIQRMQAL